MATTPVEVKKTPPVPANTRFAGGWGIPSLRRMFDVEPAFRHESTFSVPSPAVDVTEDDVAFKVTAEVPGMSEKEIEVLVSGDSLTLKGEKRQEREQEEKNFYLPSVPTVHSSAASTCRRTWIATRSPPTSPRAC